MAHKLFNATLSIAVVMLNEFKWLCMVNWEGWHSFRQTEKNHQKPVWMVFTQTWNQVPPK